MRLGIDTYSLHLQGWDVFGYLDYAHKNGADVVQTGLGRPERLDDDYLRQIKARADELGLEFELSIGSICPSSTSYRSERGPVVERVTTMLHVAKALGASIVHCCLGSGADRRTATPIESHIEATIATCKAVRALALDLGIKLAIENHATDLEARELKMLVEEAGPEYVGVCIDTGGPLGMAESPFVTLQYLAPYVVTSHIRDSCVWQHPKGAAYITVAMGDGSIGIREWACLYREQCKNASFTLEIITETPPRVANYLEPEFWATFRKRPAWELARFEELARTGHPYMAPVFTIDAHMKRSDWPPEYLAAIQLQQRQDLARSLRYCREVLGVGERPQ